MLYGKLKLWVSRLQIHNYKTFKISSANQTNFKSLQIPHLGTTYTL